MWISPDQKPVLWKLRDCIKCCAKWLITIRTEGPASRSTLSLSGYLVFAFIGLLIMTYIQTVIFISLLIFDTCVGFYVIILIVEICSCIGLGSVFSHDFPVLSLWGRRCTKCFCWYLHFGGMSCRQHSGYGLFSHLWRMLSFRAYKTNSELIEFLSDFRPDALFILTLCSILAVGLLLLF